MNVRASCISASAFFLFGLTTLCPCPASGAEIRDLCPTRPGLGTAPCIVDTGHMLIEVGLGDWTVDSNRDTRTDTLLIGDMLFRYGLSDLDELQFGWTPFGHVRERDKSTDRVMRAEGVGDVTVGYKHSVSHPDGTALSVAIQPFVTLPVGGSAIGNHDWSAGLLIPVSFDVSDRVQLQATPEIDASGNGEGHGRHAAYGMVAGVGFAISGNTGITLELSAFRDRDPAGHTTELLAGVSATWQPSKKIQLDIGSALGLNNESSDAEVAVGISRRL